MVMVALIFIYSPVFYCLTRFMPFLFVFLSRCMEADLLLHAQADTLLGNCVAATDTTNTSNAAARELSHILRGNCVAATDTTSTSNAAAYWSGLAARCCLSLPDRRGLAVNNRLLEPPKAFACAAALAAHCSISGRHENGDKADGRLVDH